MSRWCAPWSWTQFQFTWCPIRAILPSQKCISWHFLLLRNSLVKEFHFLSYYHFCQLGKLSGARPCLHYDPAVTGRSWLDLWSKLYSISISRSLCIKKNSLFLKKSNVWRYITTSTCPQLYHKKVLCCRLQQNYHSSVKKVYFHIGLESFLKSHLNSYTHVISLFLVLKSFQFKNKIFLQKLIMKSQLGGWEIKRQLQNFFCLW